jgi:hypothetical protein
MLSDADPGPDQINAPNEKGDCLGSVPKIAERKETLLDIMKVLVLLLDGAGRIVMDCGRAGLETTATGLL